MRAVIRPQQGDPRTGIHAHEDFQLFLVQRQPGIVLGTGVLVRQQHLRRQCLHQGPAMRGGLELMRKLRHHHDDRVLLARRDQPVFDAARKVAVVQRLPGFINDDDRGALVLDLPFDAPEDVGQDRHAGLLIFAIQNVRQVEADKLAVQREGVLDLAPEDPAEPVSLGPFVQPIRQRAPVMGGPDQLRKLRPGPQVGVSRLGVLAHGIAHRAGLFRLELAMAGFHQVNEPVAQPFLSGRVRFDPERIEARAFASLQFGIPAAQGAHGHFHAPAIVEDKDPRTDPLRLCGQECRLHGFARPHAAKNQRVTVAWFLFRIAFLMEIEAVGTARNRRKPRDRSGPRDIFTAFAHRSTMQRGEVGKLIIGDHAFADAEGTVAGMLAEIDGAGRIALRDHLDARAYGDVADHRADFCQLLLSVGIDGNRHLMLSEGNLTGCQTVLRLLHGLDQVGGLVVDRGAAAQFPRDPLFHDAAVDRNVVVRHHHIDGQVQFIEHGHEGLARKLLDRVDHAHPIRQAAPGQVYLVALEGDARVADGFRNGPVQQCVEGRNLDPGIDAFQKAEQLTAGCGQHLRVHA